MNYRNETEIRTGMVKTLPKWATDEHLYNCENFYNSMFATNKEGMRKSVASILRKIAERLDPTSMELKYSSGM